MAYANSLCDNNRESVNYVCMSRPMFKSTQQHIKMLSVFVMFSAARPH